MHKFLVVSKFSRFHSVVFHNLKFKKYLIVDMKQEKIKEIFAAQKSEKKHHN